MSEGDTFMLIKGIESESSRLKINFSGLVIFVISALILVDIFFSVNQAAHAEIIQYEVGESQVEERGSKKEMFEILYESLRDVYKGYYIDVMKTLGLLVIGIGWILTSDKSRNFLSNNRAAYYSSLIAVAVLGIIHSLSSYATYVLSNKKMSLLSEINYVDEKYYGDYQISGFLFLSNSVMNISLIVVLFVMIYSLRHRA